MAIAGELLSRRQRALWKRYEQPGGLEGFTDAELADWIRACRRLADSSDRDGASKARRLWHGRAREGEAELGRRDAPERT
jgi:hypothetical protein